MFVVYVLVYFYIFVISFNLIYQFIKKNYKSSIEYIYIKELYYVMLSKNLEYVGECNE